MTKVVWLLGAALVALVITRTALRLRTGRRSPLQALARDYLGEQLMAQGIAKQVPPRCIAEIAQRYADAVESRPLGRLAAASELTRRIDEAVVFIADWVRDGRQVPRSAAKMPLPGLRAPDALLEDALDPDD
jgi:hypothetical protein